LICLSGHVKNRGVFEIPLGKVTLRDIIFDPGLGGGLSGGRRLKFVHLGGQSGAIGGTAISQTAIGGPDLLDTIYSYTDLKKAGLSVGSGAIVVMDETVSIIEYLQCVTEFFIHESCGKCIPCREGNKQLLKILHRLSVPPSIEGAGVANSGDLDTLRRLVRTMTDASFCGLGQTAAAALNSAWKHFKAEFEANVKDIP
jgi:NADH-quinone oxidoreductase subunit F